VRTVRRWQKEGGEARSAARSTPVLRINVRGIATEQQRQVNARAFRERVQEQGLDVGACRVMVLVYNEDRARPRNVGPQHIDGANEGLIDALDALEDGVRRQSACATLTLKTTRNVRVRAPIHARVLSWLPKVSVRWQ